MDIYAFLEKHGVAYERIDHPPVFTCEEAEALVPANAGANTKNLFVKDKKGRHHLLVVLRYDQSLDLKALGEKLGLKNLSLASADRLKRFLGVEPGSVTMLGLANDTEHGVRLYVDATLWESEAFACHPLVNTATLVLKKDQMLGFLTATGHEVTTLNLDE